VRRAILQHVGLVVAAGGSGQRFDPARNKLLVPLCGVPLFCHCLQTLAPLVPPGHCVLVVDPAAEQDFRHAVQRFGLRQVTLVHGGRSRQESVWNGLQALPASAGIVAVQDAARPLTSPALLERCVASAIEHGSGVAARPVTDTIKRVDEQNRVLETPPRVQLRAAETPQVFRREILEQAYRRAALEHAIVTDDAQAVEALGLDVHLVEHTDPNPKVTYTRDLRALEAWLSPGNPSD
jgi:2-C-methyl-D-erythritol 4-phosphate cytidylyltransferase